MAPTVVLKHFRRLLPLAPLPSQEGFILRNRSPLGNAVDGFVHFRAPTLVSIIDAYSTGTVTSIANHGIYEISALEDRQLHGGATQYQRYSIVGISTIVR